MQLGTRCRVHILRYAGSCSHENGIVASTEKTVDSHIVLTHHAVGDKLYTESLYLAHLSTYHGLGQSIFRNTIHQHTTRLGLSFEDRDIKALTCQITSNSKSGRTRTDDSHTSTSLLWKLLAREVHLGIEVGNKLLQLAYLYRFSLLAQHTVALALLLMRTHTSTDCRKVALRIDDRHSRTHVSHGKFMHKVGDIISDRTSLLTLWHLTVEASLGFLNSFTCSEALVYHLETSHLFCSCRCYFCCCLHLVILLLNLFTHNLIF